MFGSDSGLNALLLLLVGLVAVVPLRRIIDWRPNLLLALSGVLLYAAPLLLLSIFPPGSGPTRTALAGLAPAMICVAYALDEEQKEFANSHLLAAVIGLGGLLLVLPIRFPQDLCESLRLLPFLGAIGCIAVGSVLLPIQVEGMRFSEILAWVCLPNGLLLLLEAWVPSNRAAALLSSGSLMSSLASLAQLTLFLWLARRMAAMQLAARFLFIPVLTVLEGFILIGGGVTFRMVVGIIMTSCAAVYLLLSHPEESFLGLSLR